VGIERVYTSKLMGTDRAKKQILNNIYYIQLVFDMQMSDEEEEYTIDDFRKKFMSMQVEWGYGLKPDPNSERPNYERITHGNFRVFQHLTDCLMRFLYHGVTLLTDQLTMTDVVFYKEGGEFNVRDDVLESYLQQCGPFFINNRNKEIRAYRYLKKCDPSSITCLLRVSLKWARVVRVYATKHADREKVTIIGFTEAIKAAALTEIENYLDEWHSVDIEDAVDRYNDKNEFNGAEFLDPDTVKGAILAMASYYDPESSDDDDDDDDNYGATSSPPKKRMRTNLISDVVNTTLRF
jgi:hypothetical protein